MTSLSVIPILEPHIKNGTKKKDFLSERVG